MKQLISNKRHFEIAAHTRTFPLFFHKKNKQTNIYFYICPIIRPPAPECLADCYLKTTVFVPALGQATRPSQG